MDISFLDFFSQRFNWIITSVALIAVNYGVMKTQLKNKLDKSEIVELIDLKITQHQEVCRNSVTAFPSINGAKLETEVANIKESLRVMQSDVKEILRKVG